MAIHAVPGGAPDRGKDTTAGNTFKGVYAAFGAAAIGTTLKYTSLIPFYHASAAALVSCGLGLYAGLTIVPILHDGYEKVKRDFRDMTGTKVSMTDMAICSSISAIATLATWTLNPAAALVVGFGTLFAAAYQFSTPSSSASAPASSEVLPGDFMTQKRNMFPVEVGGVAYAFSTLAEAYDTLKTSAPGEEPQRLLLAVLVSYFINAMQTRDPGGMKLLAQLFRPLDRTYTHQDVNLTAVLLQARSYMQRFLEQQAAPQRGAPFGHRQSGRGPAALADLLRQRQRRREEDRFEADDVY